jgi:uncharacterized membrane protein (DUF485 family)
MVTGSPPAPRRSTDCQDHARYIAISQDERFIILRRRTGRIVLLVISLFIGWYFLYVGASVFARGLLRQRLAGHVNVALAFGVLQIVVTFALAWRYSRHARHVLDPMRAQIAAEAERCRTAGAETGGER